MLKHAKALSATITNSNAMCLSSNDNSNGGINIVDVDNANTFSVRVDPKDYTRFYIRIRCDSNSFYISKFDKPQDGENGTHGRGPIADTMAVNVNDEIIAINGVNVNKFNLDVVLLSAFLLKKWRESSLSSPMILTFARNKTFTVDRTAREKVANKIFKILESTDTSADTNSSLRETASSMETLRLREAESTEAGTKSNAKGDARDGRKFVASNNTNNNNNNNNFISEKEINSKSKRDNSNSKGSSPKPRGTTISNKGQYPKKAPKRMHDDDDYEDDQNDDGDDDDDGNNFNAPKSKLDKLKSKSPPNTTLNTSSNTSTLSKKRYRGEDEKEEEFNDDNGAKSGNNDCDGNSDTGHPCDDESSPFFIPLDLKDFAKRELDRLRSETRFLPEITVSEFMELAAVTKEKNPIGSQSWFRYGATATGLGEEHPGTTVEYHSSGKFVKARWGNGKDNWCWCQPEIITSAEEKLKRGRGR